MNSDDALAFLAEHQRLQDDAPQAVIDMLDGVRRHFLASPDERCVPLFMGLVDDHMGWGIFQLFDDVFRSYPQDVLTPHLQRALAGASRGSRWWAAQWALDFPSPDLAPLLSRLLLSPEDADAHYFAIAALGEICGLRADPGVLAVLRGRAEVEQDAETRELLASVLLKCEREGKAG